MKDFRSLMVWEKGHQLTLFIYKQTHSFPKEELYGLTSQIEELLLPFQLILRKVAEEAVMLILLVFYKSLLALQVKQSICCFFVLN